MHRNNRVLVLLCCLGAFIAGCDSQEENEPQARVRVVQAASDLDDAALYIDLELTARNLDFGDASSYVSWDAGVSLLEVRIEENGLEQSLVSRQVVLEANQDYTILIAGTADASSLILVEDHPSTIISGQARLRVVNAAEETGTVDVRVVPDEGDTAVIEADNLFFGDATEPVIVDEGVYDFFADAVSNADNDETDMLDQFLEEQRSYLFVLTNTGSDDHLSSLLIVQE